MVPLGDHVVERRCQQRSRQGQFSEGFTSLVYQTRVDILLVFSLACSGYDSSIFVWCLKYSQSSTKCYLSHIPILSGIVHYIGSVGGFKF